MDGRFYRMARWVLISVVVIAALRDSLSKPPCLRQAGGFRSTPE